jgi:FAD/FMN-containing dehydrogenase
MFVDKIDRTTAEMILDRLQSSKAMMAVAQLRVLGGAMSRVPVDATAFAHRNSRIMVNLAALYEKPEEKSTHEAWVANFAAALAQSDQGAYVNFLGEDGAERIRAAYPGSTWERLRQVKSRYDPNNLFRLNHNIQPAGDPPANKS